MINFISTYSKLLKHFIFAHFLLIEDYEQGALRKDLIVAPFVERFKVATLRKPSWKISLLLIPYCLSIYVLSLSADRRL